MLIQILGLLGAGCVLLGFTLNSTGRVTASDRRYQLLNLVGAAILTWVAIEGRQAGFTILNTVWALVAARALWKLRRSPAR